MKELEKEMINLMHICKWTQRILTYKAVGHRDVKTT